MQEALASYPDLPQALSVAKPGYETNINTYSLYHTCVGFPVQYGNDDFTAHPIGG